VQNCVIVRDGSRTESSNGFHSDGPEMENFFVRMGWVYSYDTGVRTGLQFFLSYHDIHAVLHSQFYVVQYETCVISHTHIVDCRYRCHRCHVSFCLCINFHMITQKGLKPRAGSRIVRIDPLHFLAGCCKRRLNQALSVLSCLVFVCVCCAVN